MNEEPHDGPIDKESQELIDKLLAEDQQQILIADQVKEQEKVQLNAQQ